MMSYTNNIHQNQQILFYKIGLSILLHKYKLPISVILAIGNNFTDKA